MNSVQLATITLNGETVYQFAGAMQLGHVSAVAGSLCDELTDRFGDGFSWHCSPLPLAGSADEMALRKAAADAIIAGGERLNPSPTSAVAMTRASAALLAGAIEIGVSTITSRNAYAAARDLSAKLKDAARFGGSVVVQIEREGKTE